MLKNSGVRTVLSMLRLLSADKRVLVVRNLAAIERRRPAYRSASAAFMAADPLRMARESIERSVISGGAQIYLLVAGEATDSEATRFAPADSPASTIRSGSPP